MRPNVGWGRSEPIIVIHGQGEPIPVSLCMWKILLRLLKYEKDAALHIQVSQVRAFENAGAALIDRYPVRMYSLSLSLF